MQVFIVENIFAHCHAVSQLILVKVEEELQADKIKCGERITAE